MSIESNIAAIANSLKEHRSEVNEPWLEKSQKLPAFSSSTINEITFAPTVDWGAETVTYARIFERKAMDTSNLLQQIQPSQAESAILVRFFGPARPNPFDIASALGGAAWLGAITPELPRWKATEDWNEQDDERFDALVEKEAAGHLDAKEANELELLSRKRDMLIVKVPEDDVRKERMRSDALAELQSLLQKYAPLFATKR